MGLKSEIVIVNEFTVKGADGKGSRGSNMDEYLDGYMARPKAVEPTAPVRLNENDGSNVRYSNRKKVTDNGISIEDIKEGMRKAQGKAGIAFSDDSISLSHRALKRKSKALQTAFDNDKTIMKTVLAFNDEFLKRHGIIPSDFVCKDRGGYRGNVDQVKLRMAINHGLKKMSRRYDDLRWTGVIQVDTMQLHCHLVIYDNGEGKHKRDGKQNGQLYARDRLNFRRGVDMFLDESKSVAMLSSNVTYDRHNALCFIKKFTHKTMADRGTPQFLLACLPADKKVWRSRTNRTDMKKANAITREYVVQVLNQPGSGYKEAIRHILDYADYRKKKEDLTNREYQQLLKNGEERIVQDCMNGVYAVLKQIPDANKTTMTPMMSAMSLSYEEMASRVDTDPMVEFGFRLRSYSTRLEHHKKERRKYRDAVDSYDTKTASADSLPLYNFFKFEEEYNAKLMCKYQHFLSFLPPADEYEDDFKELMDYKDKIRSLKTMMGDPSFKRRTPDSAETYGKQVYDQHGGRFVATSPDILENRLSLMEATYGKKEDDFRLKLSNYGLTLDDKGVSTKKPYEFDEVKALDLHHLHYDFTQDIVVSKVNADAFVSMADARRESFEAAKRYLQDSEQDMAIEQLPVTDVRVMSELADKVRENPVVVVKKPTGGRTRGSNTVNLNEDFTRHMELAVKTTIQAVQLGDDIAD